MKNDLLVQLIVTLAASGGVVATINAFASRRRTRAESQKTHAEVGGVAASAAKELGDTAVALLVPLREEFGRLAARVTQQDAEIALLRAEVRAGQSREEGADRLLYAHTLWARTAAAKLSAAGIPIDPPPTTRGQGGP